MGTIELVQFSHWATPIVPVVGCANMRPNCMMCTCIVSVRSFSKKHTDQYIHLKKLSFSPKRATKIPWSSEEDSCLIQFVVLHKDLQPTENDWPCIKPNHPYWLEAAKFIKQNAKGSHLRKCEYLLRFHAVV